MSSISSSTSSTYNWWQTSDTYQAEKGVLRQTSEETTKTEDAEREQRQKTAEVANS